MCVHARACVRTHICVRVRPCVRAYLDATSMRVYMHVCVRACVRAAADGNLDTMRRQPDIACHQHRATSAGTPPQLGYGIDRHSAAAASLVFDHHAACQLVGSHAELVLQLRRRVRVRLAALKAHLPPPTNGRRG